MSGSPDAERPSPSEEPLPASEAGQDSGPTAGATHTVRANDSIASIAAACGHFGPTIWNHADNAELRRLRSDPEILLAGDRVTVPPLRPKQQPVETGATHLFRRRGVPAWIALVLRDADRGTVFADKPYALTAGDVRHEGRTDAEGRLRHWVPPQLTRGTLELWPERPDYPAHVTWSVTIGAMDPIDTDSGLQRRLVNLGFDCGDELGTLGPATRAAVRAFRRRHELEPGDEVDETFRQALVRRHGS